MRRGFGRRESEGKARFRCRRDVRLERAAEVGEDSIDALQCARCSEFGADAACASPASCEIEPSHGGENARSFATDLVRCLPGGDGGAELFAYPTFDEVDRKAIDEKHFVVET